MRGILRCCCFSPSQTYDLQGSLHNTCSVTEIHSAQSKECHKVLVSLDTQSCTSLVDLLFGRLCAAVQAFSSASPAKRPWWRLNRRQKPGTPADRYVLGFPEQTRYFGFLANFLLSASILPLLPKSLRCRLLGHATNTSHKQHGHPAADQCSTASRLLQGKAPDNTTTAQVTILSFFAKILHCPAICKHAHGHVQSLTLQMCKC